MRSSQAAADLIVNFEVTSKAVYTKKYQRPEWPGLQSGVTIGIGYDCGYATTSKIAADWGPHLPKEMVTALVNVAGKQGSAAKNALAACRKIVSVPWDAAMAVFEEVDMPRWEGIVARGVPGATTKLNADCFGVIVSIAYNRGPSFGTAGDRYREMRAIKQHVAEGNISAIPADIRSMVRLWPDTPGLQRRRKAEAALFQKGLDAMGKSKLGIVDDPEPSQRQENETGDDRSMIEDYDTDGVTPEGNEDTDADPVREPAPSVSHAAPPDKATVEVVKKRLAAFGYNEFGMLNGDWGGRTVGAIAAFKLDRGLTGPATIDDELKSELDAAEREGWHRPVADARKNATARDIAPMVPGVKQNWWQKLVAWVVGVPAAAGAYFKSMFGDDADPTSWVSTAKHFLGGVPGEVWLLAIVAIAGFILYNATRAQNDTVQAYREGKIN